jgi:hypothetical protein
MLERPAEGLKDSMKFKSEPKFTRKKKEMKKRCAMLGALPPSSLGGPSGDSALEFGSKL